MALEEDWKQAGHIAYEGLQTAVSLAKKGNAMLDVLNAVETRIAELGGIPAFPAQMSTNEIAAHYCPEDDDTTVFDDQLICIDIGGSYNGCMGDNAITVDLSDNYKDLVRAPQEALNAALDTIAPGVSLGKVGAVISQTIRDAGFQPVRNLSGHGLGINQIHTWPTVPNVNNNDTTKIEEGWHLACEPFATSGVGIVEERGDPSVFVLTGTKGVRTGFVKEILKTCQSYEGRPFTTRWLTARFSANQVRYALNQFVDLGILKQYPPLVEKSNKPVAQAEKSLIVTSDGCDVLTK